MLSSNWRRPVRQDIAVLPVDIDARHLIARLHFNHVRASIWLDTMPKVRRLCFPGLVLVDHRIDSYVELPEYGSEIWFGGLSEKERVEKDFGSGVLCRSDGTDLDL